MEVERRMEESRNYAMRGKTERARSVLQDALSEAVSDEQRAELCLKIAGLYIEESREEKALEWFEWAASHDRFSATVEKAGYQIASGSREEGREQLEGLLEDPYLTDEQRFQARLQLDSDRADEKVENGDSEGAVKLLEDRLDDVSSEEDRLSWSIAISDTYWKMGRAEEALARIERAPAHDVEGGELVVADIRARYLSDLGRHEESREVYDRLLRRPDLDEHEMEWLLVSRRMNSRWGMAAILWGTLSMPQKTLVVAVLSVVLLVVLALSALVAPLSLLATALLLVMSPLAAVIQRLRAVPIVSGCSCSRCRPHYPCSS